MFLDRLALIGFRNYGELEIEFQRPVNVFIGENGQGKTNLLEAISLLSSGDSFRSVETEQMIQNNSAGGLIRGVIRKQSTQHRVQLKLREGQRQIELNEKKSSRQTLIKNFSAVVFSPESLSIVKAGPSERRKFFDEMILSLRPEKFTLFADYQKALRARNRLLKDISDGPREKKDELLGVLDSLNPTFLFLATEVSLERINFIKNLLPEASQILKNVLEYQSVDIAVDYVISTQSAIDWDPNQVYDAQRSRLRELARGEIDSGQSLIGPHKHDVRFLFQGKDARSFCSQGQQRAIVLAFKIAQILLYQQKRGETPFLLLDDVLSELDHVRRRNLLTVLSSLKSQIFMTSTELGIPQEFAKTDLEVFTIENGSVKRSG